MTRKVVPETQADVLDRYGSLRVLRDGRVRLSPSTLPGLPELDFSVSYVAEMGNSGIYVRDSEDYRIYARCPWKDRFFMLFLSKGRIVSACFNYGLTQDEMQKAVAILRKAGGGIERWIVPGLEYTRDSLARINAHPDFPSNDGRRQVIEELLTAARDLPVAEPWKRQRSQWERGERVRNAPGGAPVLKARSAAGTRGGAGRKPGKGAGKRKAR